MTDKIRRFKCNTHVTLPSGFTPVDGRPNMRFEPGQTFDVDDAKCQTQQRYVLGRIRAKDFEEVDYVPEPAPEVTVTAAPTSVPGVESAPIAAPELATSVTVESAPAPAAIAPENVPITPSSPPPTTSSPGFAFNATLTKKA